MLDIDLVAVIVHQRGLPAHGAPRLAGLRLRWQQMRSKVPPLPSRDPATANAAIIDSAPYWLWLGGAPVIDFVNTVRLRHRGGVELLRTPSDLDGWLAAALGSAVSSTERDLAAAHSLREAIDACLQVVLGLVEPDDAAIACINDHSTTAVLSWTPAGFTRTARAPSPTSGALARLAVDAAHLLEHEPDRIAVCGGTDCSLRILSPSPSRPRRWCSMAGCGNRSKAARYRGRTGR